MVQHGMYSGTLSKVATWVAMSPDASCSNDVVACCHAFLLWRILPAMYWVFSFPGTSNPCLTEVRLKKDYIAAQEERNAFLSVSYKKRITN